MPIYMSGVREDGSRDVIAAGKVTRDSEFEYTPSKRMPKASFSMAVGKKKYLNCVSLGNSDVTSIAANLEKGDVVLVSGTYTENTYTGRDGTEKVWRSCLLSFCTIQPALPSNLDAGTEGNAGAPLPEVPDFNELDGDDGELPF